MIYKVLSKLANGLPPALSAVMHFGLVSIFLQRILWRIIVYRQAFPCCRCAECGPVFATSVPVYPGGPKIHDFACQKPGWVQESWVRLQKRGWGFLRPAAYICEPGNCG